MGKISIKMLIVSIIGGLIYGFLGNILYGILHFFLPRPVVTMVFYGGLFLFVALALFIAKSLMYSSSKGKIRVGRVVLLFVILLAFSALFEFLYDIVRKPEEKDAESYIFAIDISGSMEDSDPNRLSIKALEDLVESKDDKFTYAVYLYNEQPQRVRDLLPNSEELDLPEFEYMGGTGIQATLKQILKDIDKGELEVGKRTKVILMSDGYPTDVDSVYSFSREVLSEYADREIPISTVGLLYADVNFMTMIAEKTNGSFTNVKDADLLGEAFEEAGSSKIDMRNLLNFREPNDLNVLLAILRVLFTVLICMVIAVAKTELCENFRNTNPVLISSAIGGTLAGIAIEVGMNWLIISPITMRVLACVLIAFTLIGEDVRKDFTDTEIAKMYY